MAYKIIDSRWVGQRHPRIVIIADAESDVSDFPPSATGSRAIVVDEGRIYFVNASGNWVEFGGDANG